MGSQCRGEPGGEGGLKAWYSRTMNVLLWIVHFLDPGQNCLFLVSGAPESCLWTLELYLGSLRCLQRLFFFLMTRSFTATGDRNFSSKVSARMCRWPPVDKTLWFFNPVAIHHSAVAPMPADCCSHSTSCTYAWMLVQKCTPCKTNPLQRYDPVKTK